MHASLTVMILILAISQNAFAVDEALAWSESPASPAIVEGERTLEIHYFRTMDQRMGMIVEVDQEKRGLPLVKICDASEIVYQGILGSNAGNDRIQVKEVTPYPPVGGGVWELTYYTVQDVETGVMFIVPFDKKGNAYSNDISEELIGNLSKYLKHIGAAGK